MDERSQQIIVKAMAITLALAYVFLFITCIWKYATTKDITNSTFELFLIVLIPLSIAWFDRKDESLLIPRTFTGKEYPTESNEQTKKKRKVYYVYNALGLAGIFLFLEIIDSIFIQKDWHYFTFNSAWSNTVNIFITLSLEYVIGVIVFFMIGFVWSELSLKRYKRKLDDLEDQR